MVAGAVTTANVDARAGGLVGAPDNPYIYIDLKTGMKVAVNDLDARMATTWDISLKRASVRMNGGDSGTGGQAGAGPRDRPRDRDRGTDERLQRR